MRAHAEADLLGLLEVFGGWNTSGNTLGSVVTITATWVSAAPRTHSTRTPRAVHSSPALSTTSSTSPRSAPTPAPHCSPDRFPMADDDRVAEAERVNQPELAALPDSVLPGGDVRIAAFTLPWRRSFEIGIALS